MGSNLRDCRHEDQIEEQFHPRHASARLETVLGA
jgi:hypothetical protein